MKAGDKTDSADLDGLTLATKVVHGRVPFDEALIRAQVGGYLDTLIKGLNAYAGKEFFNLGEARDRINRGEAQRALRGNGPPIVLPEDFVQVEIDSHGLPVPTEPTEGGSEEDAEEAGKKRSEQEKELRHCNEKLLSLQDQRTDIKRLLAFIESVQRHRSRPPKPWVSSLVVLGISGTGSAFALLFLKSSLGAIGSFGLGLFLATLLFQREYAWYERLQKIEEADAKQRELNAQIQTKRLNQVEKEIREIRMEARRKFKDLEKWLPEGEKLFKTEYTGLFPEAADLDLKD